MTRFLLETASNTGLKISLLTTKKKKRSKASMMYRKVVGLVMRIPKIYNLLVIGDFLDMKILKNMKTKVSRKFTVSMEKLLMSLD